MKLSQAAEFAVVALVSVLIGACASFDGARFQRDLQMLLADTTGKALPIRGVAGNELRSLKKAEKIAVVSAPHLNGQRSIVRGKLVSILEVPISDTVFEQRRLQIARRSSQLPRASYHRLSGEDPEYDRFRTAGQITVSEGNGEEQTLFLFEQDVIIPVPNDYEVSHVNPFGAIAFMVAVVGIALIAYLSISIDDQKEQDPISDAADGCARTAIIMIVGGIVIALVLVLGLAGALM